MNLNELIVARKKDIGRKGLRPGKARVLWHGYEPDGRRRFSFTIPATPGHIMHVSGTCAFDESDIGGTESNMLEVC